MTGVLGDVLLAGGFIGFLLFTVLYFFGSDWGATTVGRNAMAFMAVGSIVLGLSMIRLAVGDARFETIRDEVRIVSFFLVNVVVWWRVVLLARLQREERKR